MPDSFAIVMCDFRKDYALLKDYALDDKADQFPPQNAPLRASDLSAAGYFFTCL
ncbi:MAG: hypothetical protein HOL98_06020 [Gammaproteobacteria bacterium]|jgi:hypothetical protein|nr:hypothetical protein [Gammaproteobacteria bacterium]MBT6244401.1 hypothetical protein [Gammaproteobacteria bacterium]